MNTTHVCAGPLHIYCTYIYITHICVRPYIYLCAERHIILCFTANEVFYCVRTPVHTHWKIAGRNKFVPHSMSADCSSRGLLVPRPAARALCLARFPWLAHCCCDCWPARYACCCCSAFTLSLCFCARALPISRLRSTRASEAGDKFWDKFSLLANFCLYSRIYSFLSRAGLDSCMQWSSSNSYAMKFVKFHSTPHNNCICQSTMRTRLYYHTNKTRTTSTPILR